MTRRNKFFAALCLSCVAFALVMMSLNFNWTLFRFNWYGWVWVISLSVSVIELVWIYRDGLIIGQQSNEIVISGVCKLDVPAAPIEDIPVITSKNENHRTCPVDEVRQKIP